MDSATILSLTREALPDLNGEVFEVTEIAKDGSDRRYFRLKTGDQSLIFCQYGEDTPENSRFAQHTDFLDSKNVAVPKILSREPENRRLWVEDLGEKDLWSFQTSEWEPCRQPHYERTIEMGGRIHALVDGAV